MGAAVPASPGKRRGVRQLPRGRHGLPRAFVVSNQRERIIDALAVVCAGKGYAAATVEDVIAQAGVSRRTFYDLFSSKQECFLVAYELVMDRVLRAVERAYASENGQWPERMARLLRTLLTQLAAEPELARLVMVDVLAAGQPALERRDTALRRFEVFFTAGAAGLPLPDERQRLLARAVIGGLAEALYGRIAAGATDKLPDAGPDLLYCMLVPYLGHNRARAASAQWERLGFTASPS
jgi:AcrR family transcriptional regulator